MLIRQVFNNEFAFQATAISNVNKQQQLLNFTAALQESDRTLEGKAIPENWFFAFQYLRRYLEKLETKKKVIFF